MNLIFFFVLLLEDLPQISVVLAYRAFSPKEPGTYSFFVEIVSFFSSIYNILSKMSATGWEMFKDKKKD